MSIAQQQIVAPVPTLRVRFFAHPIVRIVIGTACTMVSIFAPMAIIDSLLPKPLRVGWPLLLAAVLGMLGYRWFTQRVEKRTATELALARAPREIGTGLALGATLGLAVAGVLAAVGAFTVTGSDGWGFMLKSLPEQIMVACFEELVFRAVLFRIVEQRWGSRNALIVSFVMFALAHLPNEHVSALAILITGVAGVTLSACYMLTRRLWLSIGMHFGWNYLYDGVFAVPVSGHPARGWLQVSMSGPDWLTGGSYGVEASLVTLLVWGAAAVWLLRRAYKQA
jgi:membrane protease YdiL (CAAX protease family)